MPQQPSGRSRRNLLVVLVLVMVLELTVAALVLARARGGDVPVLDAALQHRIAYAWVLLTVLAAVGAYALGGGAGDRPHPSFGRALGVASLTALAACAGLLTFLAVPVWPIPVIAGLTAVLGLVLAWPRASMDAGAAGPEHSTADAGRGLDQTTAPPSGAQVRAGGETPPPTG